jgi:glyoxylase-like metal-dependent hydrolase (beta-lactamase superfamily II)
MLLHDNDRISFGLQELVVIHTPGHTPGSVCFLAGGHLIAGDTLFPGGPGHTDTPAAFRQILDSLERRLFMLPENTLVHPGHGESTTLGRERAAFRRFLARHRDPHLCGDVCWEQA